MSSTTTLDRTIRAQPRIDFDTDVELQRDDEDIDYSGWFCVRTRPFPCPVASCDFVAEFMTAAHLVVVWPRNDDPSLFAQAHNASIAGRNPKIVEYERAFGPCIPIDEWTRLGRPIHGRLDKPSDWDERSKSRL